MYDKPETQPTLSRFVGQTGAASPSGTLGTPDVPTSPSNRSRTSADDPAAERDQTPAPDWVPKVELPTGGGAIRGSGEKFEANAFTGAGSFSVPIAVPPGRGLAPQLALTYASGAGNGPFGLGWSLGAPAIARKTERELPEYRDAVESDTFVLAGAEDLVPLRDEAGSRVARMQSIDIGDYRVYPYRPRGFCRNFSWRPIYAMIFLRE